MVSSATDLRVKELLREKRWTTKMLAEKTGMSESYLTHIKNGTRRWNEDILKRLAEAFEIHPIELFSIRKRSALERKDRVAKREATEPSPVIVPKIVPVMKEIPAHPSPYTNQVTQMTTGCKDMFVPVVGCDDPDMFCVKLDVNTLRPEFTRGDYLIVSPAAEVSSGDVVAIEYGAGGRQVRQFMQISFVDGFIILESPSHRQSPIAVAKGKDAYRLIGKVIYRYQKVD
ncbi:MAG: hypothetical protein QG604_901 [Candidatus Dependentiae bacterium]|nr:hypothetical protein [Candidatus Dependentiae bacterium]